MNNIPDYCVRFICQGKYGTGILITLENENRDMIITAAHCLPTEDEKEVRFIGIGLVCRKIWKHEKLDFGVIVIEKAPDNILKCLLSMDEELNASENFILCGYPGVKEGDDVPYEVLDASFVNITPYNSVFKINNLENTLERTKKELINGMSGSPIIQKQTKSIVGIFYKSGHIDMAYNEIIVIPLFIIFKILRENDIIYFKNGNYKSGIVLFDFKESCDTANKETVPILLIGQSGSGKSAFIKTFLKHSDLVDATGEGQTTRTNIEYKIYKMIDKPVVEIQFLNKGDFVALRMEQSRANIRKARDGEAIKDGKLMFADKNFDISEVFNHVMRIKGFFDYKEFDFDENKKVSNIIEEEFAKWFPGSINQKIEKKYSPEDYKRFRSYLVSDEEIDDEFAKQKKEETNKDISYRLDDIIELFYQRVYEIGFEAIKKLNGQFNKSNNITIPLRMDISDDEKDFLTYSLKVDKRNNLGLSYTGFISKVVVKDRVCDEYLEAFDKTNITELILIDTYGLDHEKLLSERLLRDRMPRLFDQYQEIETVFYLRKLGSAPPTDLSMTIPTLYNINPNVRVYVVFTEIDKNDIISADYDFETIVNLMEINQTNTINAVQYFNQDEGMFAQPHEIKKTLKEHGISDQMSESIYELLRKNLMPYCSAGDKEVYSKFHSNNRWYIEKLFTSIINKEHLGSGIINIASIKMNFTKESMSNEIRESIINLLEKMFQYATENNWGTYGYGHGHWKTQVANISRIRNNKLGYWGTYCDVWNRKFYDAYNHVFSKLSNEDFVCLFSTDPQMQSSSALQQILNSFSRYFLGCAKENNNLFFVEQNHCNHCDLPCFKKYLLSSYEENELFERGTESRHEWLNNRFNFDVRFLKIKDEMFNWFLHNFLSFFIDECLKHNSRIIRTELKKECEMEINKIKKIIKEYLENNENDLSGRRINELISETNIFDM